jgi:hypothetical protein
MFLVVSSASHADTKEKSEIGLLVGDPITVALEVPVARRTFLSVHAGIWTWHLWHEIKYDTPYLSIDLARFIGSSRMFYIGLGIAVFFRDNPKDRRDYDAAAAVRMPIGLRLVQGNRVLLGLELAPIYQVAPAFSFDPYIIELNGGLMLKYSL